MPRDKLESAVSSISSAGLRRCSCESPLHHAVPDSPHCLPVHFIVPSTFCTQIVFLATSDPFLELVPLSTFYANPAELEWTSLRLNIRDNNPYICGREEDMHTISVLTEQSIIKLLLLLSVFSPNTRRGYIFTFEFYLASLRQSGQTCPNLGSSSLEDLWNFMFRPTGWTVAGWEQAKQQVRDDWHNRLSAVYAQIA